MCNIVGHIRLFLYSVNLGEAIVSTVWITENALS